MADGGVIGEELLRAPVEGEGAFAVSERVTAADESQKGREGARIGRFEVSFCRMVAAGERCLIPEYGLAELSLCAEEAGNVAADRGAGLSVEETLQQSKDRFFRRLCASWESASTLQASILLTYQPSAEIASLRRTIASGYRR